jgi:hypothetical protein
LSCLCNEKNGLLWGVTSLERGNLVLFYYLSASEIWLDKRVVIVRWEVPYKRGATILHINLNLLFFLSFFFRCKNQRICFFTDLHCFLAQLYSSGICELRRPHQGSFLYLSEVMFCVVLEMWAYKVMVLNYRKKH